MMNTKDIRESLLLQSPIFREIPEDQWPDVVGAVGEKVVPAHTIIFRQGDPCDSYYIINSGKVRVFRKGREGAEVNLAQLGPGEGFGEMSLITGEPRSAHVEAVEETHLTVFPKDQFDRILRDYPRVALAFVKQLSSWLLRDNLRLEMVEELQRINKELGKINEELKNFVDAVSHDLKNPIYVIQGFSALLLKDYEEKLGEKGGRCLEHIKASALRMQGLVSDLLALSRLGRVASTFEDVPSGEIVENVTTGLQDRLDEKGIELVVADDLPTIYFDSERIYQVFENLLVNAVKFMGDTEGPKIEIGYEDRGDVHQFCVKDNGIGIDPKYHSRIFEMFQRLKGIKDKEGTGLGLAIVERVVNNHGGTVWVESEKGKGASFYFTLVKPSP